MSDHIREAALSAARERLAKVKKLPVLPVTGVEIMNTMSDEFIEMDQVADVLEKDAAVTARILGLANAAFYGQRNQVTSVRDAIIRVLGLDLTRGVALGMALDSSFNTNNCPALDLPNFWQKSLYAASINTFVTREAGCSDLDQRLSFSAGLTAEIGVLALAVAEPEALQVALIGPQEGFRSKLYDRLAFDHYDAGRALAEIWDLPEPLIHTIGHAHEEDYDGKNKHLVLSTGLAKSVAQHLLTYDQDVTAIRRMTVALGIEKHLTELLAGELSELQHSSDIAKLMTAA